MEPSGRNRWQAVANGTAAKPAQMPKTVAVGCHRLPGNWHGKEGVGAANWRFFCWLDLHELQYSAGMEPFMELPGPEHRRD
jgi:hypothetical protein